MIVDLNNLGKISTMMEESQFWTLIDLSLKESTNDDTQIQFLNNALQNLPLKEIIGFRLRTDQLLYETYTSEMWCAGYILNSGCSDDGFEYFRNWVISRGEETYYRAKVNPDTLITEIKEERDMYELEDFWFVALEAFQAKTGQQLYDYIDYDNFTTREGNYPNFTFNWNDEQPETMKVICPKLFAALWG